MGLAVLIVDDSRAMRCLQRNVLSQLGDIEIFEAEDGLDAIRKLRDREFRVDLILLDWMMPNIDGLTFARLMKGNDNLKKIPILMVTSVSDEKKMRAAWRTGVEGYLLKPFTKEMLLNAILCLDTQRLSEQVANASKEQQAAPEEGAVMARLPREMCQQVLDLAETIHVEQRTPILFKDDPVQHFFLVLEGTVEERTSPGGSEAVRLYGRGECFAVTELLSGDHLTSYFFALEGSKIAQLQKPDFETLLLNHPEITIALSRLLAVKAHGLETPQARIKAEDDHTLSGFFNVLDMPSLVQALNLRQVTGVIELLEIGSTIDLHAGQVVAAHHPNCPPEDGQAAFLRIIQEDPKKFRFRADVPVGHQNVHVTTSSLLLDTMRLLDESCK